MIIMKGSNIPKQINYSLMPLRYIRTRGGCLPIYARTQACMLAALSKIEWKSEGLKLKLTFKSCARFLLVWIYTGNMRGLWLHFLRTVLGCRTIAISRKLRTACVKCLHKTMFTYVLCIHFYSSRMANWRILKRRRSHAKESRFQRDA